MAAVLNKFIHAGVDFRVKYLTINGKRVKLAVW
jgi:hypothetical protein